MKSKYQHLTGQALQRLYIEETRAFLSALENGENWEQLEDRREQIRLIGEAIDQLQKKRKPAYRKPPQSNLFF